MIHRSVVPVLAVGVMATLSSPALAQAQIFNSASPATNATTRNAWLVAVGIGAPENLVNFESGFSNNQNIHNVGGLFPDNLVIRDSSGGAAVIIRSGATIIGGSSPVGTFSATHNESTSLVLDFSANPVDYVAFQDIDQAGTTGVITFVGGATQNFSLDTTGSGANLEEFVGIWRNNLPKITLVSMDASGDGRWGIDTIEYGSLAVGSAAPEPGAGFLMLAALGTIVAARRRYSK